MKKQEVLLQSFLAENNIIMESYDTHLNFVERNGTSWEFCRIYNKNI